MKGSILLINRLYPPDRGATGRLMQDLAQALGESGWRVSILSLCDDKPAKNYEQINGSIRHYKVKGAANPKTAFGLMMNLWRLYRRGRKLQRHDVVLSMTDPQMLVRVGRRLTNKFKARHVHWVQDVYPDLFKPLGIKLPDVVYKHLHARTVRAMNGSDQLVVIGRCMERYLKFHGVAVDKMTYIPNWVDLEVLSPSQKPSEYGNNVNIITVPTGVAKKPEEMFRDDSPKFRVLYAGNIGRAHTVHSIIAAADLLRECQEIEFVFVGDHHAHSIIANERSKRGLENIKFMPYQPIEQLRRVMESGDVHLVSMRNSVKGMLMPCKFYSALSVGRPTIYIGPHETEVTQVIEEYNAGTCLPTNDPKALADAIYAYRMNGDLWFQAQEGALRAAQTYHPYQSLNKWVEMLNNLRIS